MPYVRIIDGAVKTVSLNNRSVFFGVGRHKACVSAADAGCRHIDTGRKKNDPAARQ